jgi:hypothetical protein
MTLIWGNPGSDGPWHSLDTVTGVVTDYPGYRIEEDVKRALGILRDALDVKDEGVPKKAVRAVSDDGGKTPVTEILSASGNVIAIF